MVALVELVALAGLTGFSLQMGFLIPELFLSRFLPQTDNIFVHDYIRDMLHLCAALQLLLAETYKWDNSCSLMTGGASQENVLPLENFHLKLEKVMRGLRLGDVHFLLVRS